MFYSKYIFITKGKLAPVWLAANWEKKLTKAQVAETSVRDSVDQIIKPEKPLALRVSGQLLHGVVKIWQRKARYLLEDCSYAMGKLRQQKSREDGFSRKGTELPTGRSQAARFKDITLAEQNLTDLFEALPSDMSVEEIAAQFAYSSQDDDLISTYDNQARARDILLDEDNSMNLDSTVEVEDFLPCDEEIDLNSIDTASQNENGYQMLESRLKDDDISLQDEESLGDARQQSLQLSDNLADLGADESDDDTGAGDFGGMDSMSLGDGNQSIEDDSANQDIPSISALEMDENSLEPVADSQIIKTISPIDTVKPEKPKSRKRTRRKKPLTDRVTELRSEIISRQLRDVSDVIYETRPSAWLGSSPRFLHDRSKETIHALFIKPYTKGYCATLCKLYANTAKIVKRRRLNEAVNSAESVEDPEEPASNDISWSDDIINPMDDSSMLPLNDFDDNGASDSDMEGIPEVDFDDPIAIQMPSNHIPAGQEDEREKAYQEFQPQADGWSSRTHKMFKYLKNQQESSFSYKNMVANKARKTAVGFAYELLVLKTHDLIDLKQDSPYGDITLSKIEMKITK